MIYFTLGQWRDWHEHFTAKSSPRSTTKPVLVVWDLIHPNELNVLNLFTKKNNWNAFSAGYIIICGDRTLSNLFTLLK